jgi:hypothetical protein
MQSKDYFKNKARKLAKQTWAGPGKFGVFIVLCIIIVATFESLGLSNREKNLELRTVQSVVIPVNYNPDKVTVEVNNNNNELSGEAGVESFQEKLKISAQIDFEKKTLERENILLYGAVDQYLFEHKNYIENYENLSTTEQKTKFFMSLILNKSEDIINSNAEDSFYIDI